MRMSVTYTLIKQGQPILQPAYWQVDVSGSCMSSECLSGRERACITLAVLTLTVLVAGITS